MVVKTLLLLEFLVVRKVRWVQQTLSNIVSFREGKKEKKKLIFFFFSFSSLVFHFVFIFFSLSLLLSFLIFLPSWDYDCQTPEVYE